MQGQPRQVGKAQQQGDGNGIKGNQLHHHVADAHLGDGTGDEQGGANRRVIQANRQIDDHHDAQLNGVHAHRGGQRHGLRLIDRHRLSGLERKINAFPSAALYQHGFHDHELRELQ